MGENSASVAADLLREGWVRRTVADGDRLREISALYEELGYEVRLLPAGEEDMDAACRACLGPGGPGDARVVYTRSRRGRDASGGKS